MESFIQKEDNSKNVARYFATGIIEDNKLTGLVYGYEGGGEYSEALIFKGKYLPDIDENGENLDFDEQERLFIELIDNKFSLENLFNNVSDVIDFKNNKDGYYFFHKESESLFENSDAISTEGFSITPPSYANTYWEETPEQTWSLQEINELLKNK
jgi:hypothetical protein